MRKNDILLILQAILDRDRADGCTDCKYQHKDEWEQPCVGCSRNMKDRWTPET